MEKDLKSVKDELLLSMNLFDYNHVCNLFPVKNDKSLRSHQKLHRRNCLLLQNVLTMLVTTLKQSFLIFLSISLLNRRSPFYLKVCNLPFHHTDFMLPCELIYRDIKSEEVPSENLNILKNKLLDTATSSYAKIKSCRIKSNLNSDEAKALINLTKQKDIIIQKADKGNTVVILDKESYTEKMNELLSDSSKFESLEIPPDKYLNFLINSHDKIKNILKSLHDKESLTDVI